MKRMMLRLMSVFLTIAISILTFDSLGLDAVHAESSDIDALMEQIVALDAQIYDLAAKDYTFTYDGETYNTNDGILYANNYLMNTDDYYPFCDALQQACIERSNDIGELFLELVEVRNEYAQLFGYDNYLEYETAMRGLDDGDAEIIIQALIDYMPKTLHFLAWNDWTTASNPDGIPLEEEQFMHQAAAFYGNISPNYQTLLEDLINSDSLYLEKVDKQIGGSAVSINPNSDNSVSVHIRYADMLVFYVSSVHEFGHYLHNIQELGADEIRYFAIYETHSSAGMLLCADDIEQYFREKYGDTNGAFFTLYYLMNSMDFLWSTVLYYPIFEDIYKHPENYEPEDIAQSYIDRSLALGYDGGYSEEYRMLLGTQWCNFTDIFDTPAYLVAYAIGYTNSLWLWHKQQNGGNAAEIYTELTDTVIPDVSLNEFCSQVGLPDFKDAATYEDLDDSFYDKMASLYIEIYGAEPY